MRKQNPKAPARAWNRSSLASIIEKNQSPTHDPSFQNVKKKFTSFFPSAQVMKKHKEGLTAYVFTPDNKFKLLWDILAFTQILALSFFIPYMISFQFSKIPKNHYYIWISDIFFILDIICNFNTGFYQNGALITKRSLIAKNYFKTWFFPDFLASFPYFFFFSLIGIDHQWSQQLDLYSTQLIQLFQLCRMIRIFRFKLYIYEIQDSISSASIVMMISSFNFLLLAFLMVHWFACAQHVVYFMKDNSTVQFLENSLEERYIIFLYWSVMTMTSVGYGNDLGNSNSEMILSILAMLITSIIFGNITGGIQNVLMKFYANDRFFNYIITDARIYRKKKKVPTYLFTRMYEYIRQLKQIKKQELLQEALVLQGLSQPINEQIFTHTRVFVLERSKIFNDYRNSFLRSLGTYLKMNVNAPDDVIFQQNQSSNSMYFITEGCVNIYHQDTGTIYRELGKGKHFGQIGFFLGKKRSASAQCTSFSQIFSLDRFHFYQFLQTKPKQKEITGLIVRACVQYNLQILNVRCYLCSSNSHIAKDCVKFVFIMNKAAVVRLAKDRRYKLGKVINPFKTPVYERSIVRDTIRIKGVNRLNIPNKFTGVEEVYPHNISLAMKIKKFQHQRKKVRFQSEKLEKIEQQVSEYAEEEKSSDDDNFVVEQNQNSANINITVEDCY